MFYPLNIYHYLYILSHCLYNLYKKENLLVYKYYFLVLSKFLKYLLLLIIILLASGRTNPAITFEPMLGSSWTIKLYSPLEPPVYNVSPCAFPSSISSLVKDSHPKKIFFPILLI